MIDTVKRLASAMAAAVCALALPILVSVAPVGASTSHPKFVSVVHRKAPATKSISNAKLAALGGAICDTLSYGSITDEFGILAEPSNSFHFNQKEVAEVVTAAVDEICPSQKKALAAYHATTTTVPTIAQEAAEFLALVGPYNAALAAWQASPSNVTSTAQLQAENAPFIAASQTFDNLLLRSGFTGQVAVDARKLATDDAAVIGDLQGWTLATLTQGETALVHDEGIVNGDDDVLRSDLGLPPSS